MKYIIPLIKPSSLQGELYFIKPNGLDIIRIVKTNCRKDGENGIVKYESFKTQYHNFTIIQHFKYVERSDLNQLSVVFPEFKSTLISGSYDFLANWIVLIEALIRYHDFSPSGAINFQIDMKRDDLYRHIIQKELELFPSLATIKRSNV